MRYVRFFIGSILCGLLFAYAVPVYANEQTEASSSVMEEVPTSSSESIPPILVEPDALEPEDFLDSTIDDTFLIPDDVLHGSIDLVPLQPTQPDINEVAKAIFQIRSSIVFLVFGVIPLLCACLILYLFFRWIYGLIMSVI